MHEQFMQEALREARLSGRDVPVGAVLVRNDEIIARAHNERETGDFPFAHAEMLCMQRACEKLHTRRLKDCTLYVTLEPCPMCAGAIMHARIPRIVCGAADPVAGAMGSVWALHRHPVENCHVRVEFGCMENECRAVLQDFFRRRRVEEESAGK